MIDSLQQSLEDTIFFNEEFCWRYCHGCPKKRTQFGAISCPTDLDFFNKDCYRYGGTKDIEEAITNLVNVAESVLQ